MAMRFLAIAVSIFLVGCAGTRPMTSRTVVAPSITRAESDDLDDLRKSVRTDPPPAPDFESGKRGRRSNHGDKDSCSGTDHDTLTFSGPVVTAILSAPFSLPIRVAGDDWDHVTEFPDFPFADDVKGSLLVNNFDKVYKQSWTGTLQAIAIPQAHDIDRFGGRLLLDSASRFGIDTESNFWTKGLISKPSDELWTGDANLVFRFAESERVQWRAGAGVNWLSDSARTNTGINFTYGFDWFPVRPWTVSSVIDFGSLGHAGLFHNRTTVGAMIGPTELFAGYDYFAVGSATFHGPVAGVGWRF
jgi:hypothetical protein